MTDADLKAQSEAQARVVGRWVGIVAGDVGKATDRAHDHAILAITEVLKSTPVGRPSLRQIDRSRSFAAAVADLNALLESLVGPSVASVQGSIRTARDDLYCRSFGWWIAHLPESHSVGRSADPPPSRCNEVRGLTLHGMELRREIGAKVETAIRNLMAMLEKATRPGVLSVPAIDLIRGWADQTRSSLILACDTSIGDAAVAVESIAAVDALKPEFRPQDGIAPE